MFYVIILQTRYSDAVGTVITAMATQYGRLYELEPKYQICLMGLSIGADDSFVINNCHY